ncbi:MAG: DEAD/DEAH box helicase [Parvibaculaceae bacterium]|nr:DEAD/DEAH box helicase [Parvibaculaceae bacterium]
MTFDELGLGQEVLKAIAEAGYTTPTPIQAAAIPHVLAGRDVLGIAQTGTGKTASFTLPMIEILGRGRARARMPRSLILEPTRELAAQVAENFETYGKYHKLSMALLIGGVAFGDQDKKLDRGVDVLIATPGRLLDQISRGKVLLTGVQVLVIDEADRMLDMGFIPDIEDICRKIPFTRQTLLFSATMPPEIQRLTEAFQQNPERVEVARPASTALTVTQSIVRTTKEDKRDKLREMIRNETIKNAIIFCNRKSDVTIVYRSLEKHGFSVGALHGDLEQSVRTKTLEKFRNGELDLLVASDVAARGLDIPDVSHVFNFDVPIHAEDYVHRIGRTGRAGREGATFMLVTKSDDKYLAAIEKLIGNPLKESELYSSGGKPSPVAADAAPAADGEAAAPAEKPKRRARTAKPKAVPAQSADALPVPLLADTDQPLEIRDTQAHEQVREIPVERPAPERTRAPRERAARPAKDHAPADHAANDRNVRPAQPQPRRYQDDNHDRVIGLGDHVPAFLLRPVKLPKRKISDDIDVETETETA